jgi:hypothetical protein
MAFVRRGWKIGGVPLRFGALAALCLVSAAGLLVLQPWKTPDFQGTCVPANLVDQVGPRIYDNHRSIRVNRGQVVTVELWTGVGEGVPEWPWNEPVSSNALVLAPLPLCANPPNITTVPLTLTPFKAVGAGTARISAEVKPADASSYETFVLDVTVNP